MAFHHMAVNAGGNKCSLGLRDFQRFTWGLGFRIAVSFQF